MKPLFVHVLLLLLLVGCNKVADTTIDESASQQLIFSASLSDDGMHMEFDNETSSTLFWSEGDKIQVYSFEGMSNSSISEETFQKSHSCEMSSGAGTANATFKGGSHINSWVSDLSNLSEDISSYGLRFRAIYAKKSTLNNSSLAAGENTGEVKFTIPNKQSGDLGAQVYYTPNATEFSQYYDEHMNFIYGKNFELRFTPATALIHLCLKLDENYPEDTIDVRGLVLWLVDGGVLCGEGSINLLTGKISYPTSGNSIMQLTESIAINKKDFTNLYFCVHGTSSDTTMMIVGEAITDGNSKNFYKVGTDGAKSTKSSEFTISGGLKPGTCYTVKRIVSAR